ncbi:MAG: beta-galactosidase [Candidatus Omnitrophica bacterium]|nr:beta-galactosidase [Candidatus Omnitrophota bacterium]
MKTKSSIAKVFVLIACLGFFSETAWAEGREVIQNKRVVIFHEEGFPSGGAAVKPLRWFRENLKNFGVEATVAGAEEISDPKFMTKKRFDTLIILGGVNIPLKAAYTIPNFLSEGGNVITARIPDHCIKYSPEKKSWGAKIHFGGNGRNNNEFQIRELYWARKSLNCSLEVNPELPPYLLREMPSTAGPFNSSNFNVLDKMNYHHTGDGGFASRKNIATAANIISPVYLLPNREPADFVAYRYHSSYFNGSTLVVLGKLGSHLLNTIHAESILYTCLKLCEIRLPGEEPPSYYERVIKLHREVSNFNKLFIEASYVLRDLSFVKFYEKGKEIEELKNRMLSCEKALSHIIAEKQRIDTLLISGLDTKDQDKRRKGLLARIKMEKESIQSVLKELTREIRGINYPEEIEVKSPLGGIIVEAGNTRPLGPYMLRKDFFQTMKELGVNAYYPQWAGRLLCHYLDDPIIKKNMEGIKLDLYFTPSYNLREIVPCQGVLNPRTGEVKETGRKAYNYQLLEKKIRDFVECWKDQSILRFWTAEERCLGSSFWGEQAREEYQNHLSEKYKGINALNKRWQTDYKKFEDIKLLTKKPEAISEHSNWEDWTKFRVERYVSALKFGYDTFKKYAPEIPISRTTSVSGTIKFPYMGANFYALTKAQDISGMDGTYGVLPCNNEWIWFDVNCGKPFFTTEWSLFYSGAQRDRKRLYQGVWSTVSGGAVGIQSWLWRIHGHGICVDQTGLPTFLGWELKGLASDLDKFDHIILDGRRTEPEIKILFSDTSRCHEQSWYKKDSSPHLSSINNLYLFFLRRHHPARVIAEEAILEGKDLSKCRLLIVPHAKYLSERLQELLLTYAQNGGNLLLEGKSGEFDNYGHKMPLLFRKNHIVPSVVKKKEVFLPEAEILLINKPELAFSPLLFSREEKNVLLKYASGEPALVSVPFGKGKVLISGAPFSLAAHQEHNVSLIMGKIMEEINLLPKYICRDRNLIIREWEYEGTDYLVCAYPKGKSFTNKFVLRIRGNYKVSDYLLGTEILSAFDGKYTSFHGIITSPGGRVYKLEKVFSSKKISSSQEYLTARKEVLKPNVASGIPTSLPYKGRLLVDDPRELEGFLFEAEIVPMPGDTGEAYLTVSKGEKSMKRRVEPGKEYLFPFKKTSFLVKCVDCCFILPMHINIEIGKTKKKFISSHCTFKKEGASIFLSNGLVRLKILPKRGGRIIEYATLPEEVNHLAGDGITENEGSWPGSFFDSPFAYKLIKNTPQEIKILLRMDYPVKNMLMEKVITIKANESKIGLEIRNYNCSDSLSPLCLRLHPELNIGGIADGNDRFFIPTSKGLKILSYDKERDFYFSPSKGWAGCCDKREKVAYITSFFHLDEVKTVYVWMGLDSYNLELFTHKRKIEPSKAISLNAESFLIKGISGVGGFGKGFASHICLGNTCFSQDKEIIFEVEAGSSFLQKKKITGKVSILKETKKIMELGRFNKRISLEESLKKKFSFSAKGLPDGKYKIVFSLSGEKGEEYLKEEKNFFLIGNVKRKGLREYENFKKRFSQLKEKYPLKNKELYSLLVSLEEFRMAIENNNREKISLKREEIGQAFQRFDHN